MENNDFKGLVSSLRKACMTAVHRAGGSNIVSAFSCMDILAFLYFGSIAGEPVLRWDINKTHAETRDYLVLSEWDCLPALYTVLAHAGFFSKNELTFFGKPDALLSAFPSRKIPGIEAPFHSFGHGLSYANGIALSLKLDKKSNRVFVIMGDEELQIGQVWEAALTSAHHKLDNVVLIINNNRAQHSGLTRGIKAVDMDTISQKFLSFGWNVAHVLNGHDPAQLGDSIRRTTKNKIKPSVIICDTILGKGIPFAENKPSYHGVPFSDQEVAAAFAAL